MKVLTVVLALAASTALAQSPAAPPKPGPEQKRLAYFVGNWTNEADVKPSAFGPGGKVKGTETCEWSAGGFAVVCRNEGTGAMGEMKGIGVLAYDPDAKEYTYFSVNSMGMIETGRGKVDAGTWTWTSESKMGGKLVKSRFIMKESSPTSYTMKWETLSDTGAATTIMEGAARKSGS
ncbi:MAG TPA: DUF1579 family protein [Vicinamibacteria bacterium]|jgi:hypothetical protein